MTTATTQSVINWSRFYIPDPKTRLQTVRAEEIGRTTVATTSRETFFIKRTALGTVKLYIDPYEFSSTASLKTSATTDMVFQFNATLQECVIPSTSDPSIRPAQYKAVLADYRYTRDLPYAYSDTELIEFLPAAISYLNNTYDQTFTFTGTISNFLPVYSTTDEQELISRSLGIIVRKSFVSEQMKKGFGVAFRGPMAAIDSKAQLKEYNAQTKSLETAIANKVLNDKISGADALGQTIDVYNEDVVTT